MLTLTETKEVTNTYFRNLHAVKEITQALTNRYCDTVHSSDVCDILDKLNCSIRIHELPLHFSAMQHLMLIDPENHKICTRILDIDLADNDRGYGISPNWLYSLLSLMFPCPEMHIYHGLVITNPADNKQILDRISELESYYHRMYTTYAISDNTVYITFTALQMIEISMEVKKEMLHRYLHLMNSHAKAVNSINYQFVRDLLFVKKEITDLETVSQVLKCEDTFNQLVTDLTT